MTTTLNFKSTLDIPLWRPGSPPIAGFTAGCSMAWDMRNDISRIPLIYMLRSATALDAYSPITDDWIPLASPALAGTFGAGSACVLHPTQGPRGTLTTGSTTTSVVLSTALPATVGLNQLADRGDGVGFRIRIIGKASGSSGKINERVIVGNTAGTAPTIYLDAALDWTPASGDGYEILSGQVYMLDAGTLAAGAWKYYDIATNSYSASLATTNLPATVGTDSALLALSEGYVPNNSVPGSGFLLGGTTYDPNPSTGYSAKTAILATASSTTTLTASGLTSTLQANEYTNFQIRIVEDTTTPTSVGQRVTIASHTSGATAVFTVASWPTATPSSTCKFVIENQDNLILARSSATTTVYSYSISGNAWATATFAAAGNAHGAGVVLAQAFGITYDTTHNRRHSHIFCVRGGGSSAIDLLDIANGSTGTWTNTLTYGGSGTTTFTTGTAGAYDPVTLGGKYFHINVNGTQRMMRFNVLSGGFEAGTYLRFPQGAAVTGGKLAFAYLMDGTTKLAFLEMALNTTANIFSQAIAL